MRNLVYLLLGFMLVWVNLSYAEIATATVADDTLAEIKVIENMTREARREDESVQAPSQTSVAPRADVNALEQDVQPPSSFNQPVIDQAHVLNDAQFTELSQKLYALHQSAKAQAAVVIVPTTGQTDIFSYSMAIAEKWGLGNAKADNGLLIVVAINDRRVQILTGYGLEGVLPDIVANQIIRNQITPAFRQDEYAQGLMNAINEIERILNLDPEIARQAAEQLKAEQAKAHQEMKARQASFSRAFFILIIAVFASAIIGRRLAGIGAGVAAVVSGLVGGVGILMSLIMGFVLFVLIASSVAQGVTHAVLSSSGRGGGGFGGGRGGGYSGGGGGFGGGGASGSW